jgi:hypothetical protein
VPAVSVEWDSEDDAGSGEESEFVTALRLGCVEDARALAEQRAADPTAPGLVEWFAAGLRVALGRDDPERVVDQMSDARRLSLRRLGRELDQLERVRGDRERRRGGCREPERDCGRLTSELIS